VADNYLLVAKALASDKLDGGAVGDLKTSADNLSGDQYSSLRKSIGALAQANDLEAARTAFGSVSTELIRAVDGNK
jgi:hypothetical protein